MIRHMVLLKIRADLARDKIDELFALLAGLKDKVPGIVAFSGGPYASPEGLNKGFTHGFSMDFIDAAARDAYLPHPEHEVVKQAGLAALDGGIDGIIGFDYEL